jgi:hypothetical protein
MGRIISNTFDRAPVKERQGDGDAVARGSLPSPSLNASYLRNRSQNHFTLKMEAI